MGVNALERLHGIVAKGLRVLRVGDGDSTQ